MKISFLMNVLINRVCRLFGSDRLFVYSANLNAMKTEKNHDEIRVDIFTNINDISNADHDILLKNAKNKEVRDQQFRRRFSNEAELWVAKKKNIVGYIWTVNVEKKRPYFFPLQKNDVLLFDAEIFPEFRGQGINPLLTEMVLAKLKERGKERAFIQTREWNASEIASLKKTSFKKIGVASRKIRGRKNIVIWYDMVGHESFFLK